MSTWTTSDTNAEVIGAWVKALAEFEDVVVDAKVEAGPMRYRYATLGKVLDEVRPKLAKQGLVLSQIPSADGVTTVIFHESGQWLSFPPFKIEPVGGTPQHVGSAVSYARRYAVLAICGLATEDDDGRAASVATSPAESDPVAERVDEVTRTMKELSEENKAKLKAWADGRSLSGRVLYADRDWLSEVEAYLAEGLGYSNGDDDPEGALEGSDE